MIVRSLSLLRTLISDLRIFREEKDSFPRLVLYNNVSGPPDEIHRRSTEQWRSSGRATWSTMNWVTGSLKGQRSAKCNPHGCGGRQRHSARKSWLSECRKMPLRRILLVRRFIPSRSSVLETLTEESHFGELSRQLTSLINHWCFVSFFFSLLDLKYGVLPAEFHWHGLGCFGRKKKKPITNLDLEFLSFLFSHSTELRKKKRKYVDTRSAHPVVFFGGTCRTRRTSKGRTIHSRAGRKLLN